MTTIVGARPQFIKASTISRVIKNNDYHGSKIDERILHTGQHFDHNMSSLFFDQLDIPKPSKNLSINSSSHGLMTARMMIEIEQELLENSADLVLVYGDTNSTLAGAITAKKMGIPVVHVEAGIRSWNKSMPEEINRVLTDQCSSLLFCPSEKAVKNLAREGVKEGVHFSGDVMFDAFLYAKERGLVSAPMEKDYVFVTCHRADNTDVKENLENILTALSEIAKYTKVIAPFHPRTLQKIKEFDLKKYLKLLEVIEPQGYFETIGLIQGSRLVITDSGGMQKEAYFSGRPCVVLREDTEWPELSSVGAIRLVGSRSDEIVDATTKEFQIRDCQRIYGSGNSANFIVNKISQEYC